MRHFFNTWLRMSRYIRQEIFRDSSDGEKEFISVMGADLPSDMSFYESTGEVGYTLYNVHCTKKKSSDPCKEKE